MTNEELDALGEMARDLCHTGELSMPYRCEISDAITTLRVQLAEARAELVRRVDMHECAMAERDDATLYSDEQKVRADRAEAALVALMPEVIASLDATNCNISLVRDLRAALARVKGGA